MNVGLSRSEFRSSKSGRRIPARYHNETPFEEIHLHSPTAQEVDDLIDHNRVTEATRQTQEQKENLVKIQEFIRSNGYNTVLDLFLDELQLSHFRQKKEIRQALNDGGIAKILSFCYSRAITDTPALSREICCYAGMIFEREIELLLQSSALRNPMRAFRCNNSFKFDNVQDRIKSKAPHLLELFQNLASKERTTMYNTVANQKGDSEDWFDEEILDNTAMEVDEGDMDFTNAYVETEVDSMQANVHHGPAEVQSHVSGNISEDESISDWESEDESMSGRKSEDDDIRKVPSRNVKRCRRIVTTAISALCYSRSTHSNLLQAQMGHYFLCSRMPKRPIEVAHQLGISVSYKSISRALDSIAASVKWSVRTLAKRFPAFFISFDNMNIFARVKGERLHHEGKLLNLTSAWVAINPESKYKQMFSSDAVDISRASQLQTSDLLPTQHEIQRNLKTSQYGIYTTLNTYFGDAMKEIRPSSRKLLSPVVIPAIYQLPVQKTIIYTFPCFNKNEAIISEVTDILHEIAKQMDLKGEELTDKKVMHKGDWLTVRNMGSAIKEQVECSPEFQLGYVEPIAGLFHFQMTIAGLIFRAHERRNDEFGSMVYWMNWVNRKPNMWDSETKKVKDFHKCNSFFSHLTDAHLLAAVAVQLGVDSWNGIEEKMTSENWRKTIESVSKRVSDPGLVFGWRQETNEMRDVVHENAMLFLQHGLMYRRFSQAVRVGDTGWVKHCLKFFTIWLQNDDPKCGQLSNYRAESVHMMACLTHLWSDDFRTHWLDNCLVNPSGSPKGWMPDDQYGELVVREMKDKFDAVNANHFRNIMSRQVMFNREVRESIYRDIGATEHYQHSSAVTAVLDVKALTEKLLRERVFERFPGRTQCSDDARLPITPSIDIFGLGCAKIATGFTAENYKNSKLKKNNDGRGVDQTEVD